MLRFTVFYLLLALSLEAQTISRTKVGMGTFITLSLEQSDKRYFNKAFEIFRDVELSLSSYNPKTPIYRLNRDKKVKLDAYSYEALRLAERYYKESDAYFDITVGSITKDIYRFGEEEHIATREELHESQVGFSALEFSKESARLQEGVKVDLGGMGKGFGVDKVAEFFRANAVHNAVISASGDIHCLNRCFIEVQNPFGEMFFASFKTISSDMGVSTSGNYNRYVGSKEHNHLIDPKAKASQERFISITLISQLPNSDLDAYATAASVMPREKAYKFLDSKKLAYIVMQSDKELRVSANINYYAEDLLINYAVKK